MKLVPVVHGFELAAIDGDARGREKAHFTAEFDKARTYLAKCQATVLVEVRNSLVIRSEPTQQPRQAGACAFSAVGFIPGAQKAIPQASNGPKR